ncbi:TATA-box-binding protein [Halobacteriales archaeon SW_8_65_20]|nr:MAG: TATA-box-binding protein [Halobacteriales archaeon SW_8_65_20]
MSSAAETLEVENVVASTGIGQELDLETLADDLPTTDYAPDHFPGLVYRTESPQAAALIFRSGKVVCTGAQSVIAVKDALKIFFQELRDLGIHVDEEPEITIENMVTSGDLDERLNLNAIAIGLGLANIEYEPEQFPGLVYRLDEPPVVVLLFGSGKLVITGARTAEDAEAALDTVQSRLENLDLLK